MKLMQMDEASEPRRQRRVSGGEKKREARSCRWRAPSQARLLDETDSGLDIDALRVVAAGVNSLRSPELQS